MNRSVWLRLAAAAGLCAAAACSSDAAPAGAPDAGADVYAAPGSGMTQVTDFGENPGALAMYEYVPQGLSEGAPLVVVLHGCSQSASNMLGTGWNQLADEHGFAVVYAEQSTDNNPIQCFNWAGEHGDPANLIRGQGENQSIASMVENMISRHGVSPDRVYISGFSAGGAFAAVMLATWPDMFAAGAVQSGVPYRCATTVQGAYDCQQLNQNPGKKKEPSAWGDLVREAYDHDGPYPRVSIWHGTGDTFIVHHENRVELIEQWTNVHGIGQEPSSTEQVAGHEYTTYEAGGEVVVESYAIDGMGHAIAYGEDPEHPCSPDLGAAYYEDKGICSTWRIARFFGLTGDGGPGGGGDCPGGEDCGEPPGGDSQPPTISVTSPSEGKLLAGTVSVTAEASDDVGVDRVEFFVDGALQATDRSAPYAFEWATSAFGEGAHELRAIAYDGAGNSSVDEISTEVDNDGDGAEEPQFGGCAASAPASGSGALLCLLLSIGAAGWRRSRRESARRRRRRPLRSGRRTKGPGRGERLRPRR